MVKVECISCQELYWRATGELRWWRPKNASDNEIVLQQLWQRITGEREWLNVVTVCEN